MTWHVLCAGMGSTIPHDDVSIEAVELARANAEVMPGVCHSEAEIVSAAGQADGLLTFGVALSDNTIAALHRCRVISTVSHGFNHIDLDATTEQGIPVANTYFCHTDVANHTLLLLLACARRLTALHAELAAGRWRRDLLGIFRPSMARRWASSGSGTLAGRLLGALRLSISP